MHERIRHHRQVGITQNIHTVAGCINTFNLCGRIFTYLATVTQKDFFDSTRFCDSDNDPDLDVSVTVTVLMSKDQSVLRKVSETFFILGS